MYAKTPAYGILVPMSQQNAIGPTIPHWDLADRLRKALRESDTSVAEIARALGVTRQTVGNWIAGRYVPSRATLVAWALATGVDLIWLETGTAPDEPAPGLGTPPGTRTLNPLVNTTRARGRRTWPADLGLAA